ncbi:MAG: uracil phosphoribosyltransferase [Ignavibacteria bacterium GWA2_54_16]|nr:MAG: uracil phosphoribosyltransferase [Ignavibacteria bacterium GWA2_54_16]
MKNLTVIRHPLVQRDVTLLRDKRTPSNQFRAILRRASTMMAYEVSRELPLKKISVKTPLATTSGGVLARSVVLVPILRAGLGLIGGFVEVLPDARVGHIGLYRDEQSLKPVDYYFKVPRNLREAMVFLLDPMLATGGSSSAALTYLKKRGAKTIVFVTLVASPEGVRLIQKDHPDVKMFTCALDQRLNNRGYIIPGLGDAGDRIFGTE